MIKLAKNTQGSTLLISLVALVVLAVMGGAGYIVMKHSDNQTKKTTDANKVAADGQKNEQPKVTLHSSDEAVALVNSTYDTAIAYVKQTHNANQGEIDAVKDSLSAAFYTKISATTAYHDKLTCSQETVPSFSVDLTSADSTTATIAVTEDFNTPFKVTATVDLATLKITDIVCPS